MSDHSNRLSAIATGPRLARFATVLLAVGCAPEAELDTGTAADASSGETDTWAPDGEFPGYEHDAAFHAEVEETYEDLYREWSQDRWVDDDVQGITAGGVTLVAGDILLGRYPDDNAECKWSSLWNYLPGVDDAYWCHGMIVIDGIDGGHVAEAYKGAGAKVSSLPGIRERYCGGRIAVLRARDADARSDAARWAYDRRGTRYWLSPLRTSSRSNYCSQLIWRSYDISDINLDRRDKESGYVLPDHLSTDGDLYLVGFMEPSCASGSW